MKVLKNKKVLMGIGIAVLVIAIILVIVLVLLNPYRGKQRLEKIYYNLPEGIKSSETDKGKFKSGIEWKSNDYTLDGMTLHVIYYKGRSVKDGVARTDVFLDTEINGIPYVYVEKKLDDTFSIRRYYTQVGEDTYYIMATYKNSKANVKKLDDFLGTIMIKQK